MSTAIALLLVACATLESPPPSAVDAGQPNSLTSDPPGVRPADDPPGPATEPPVAHDPAVEPPAPIAPDPSGSAPATPAISAGRALYESCRDRMESPEADGECVKDADCARTGCGSEVCTTASAAAAGLATTCEVLPCFGAVDTCGCHAGRCQWTVLDEPRARRPVMPKAP